MMESLLGSTLLGAGLSGLRGLLGGCLLGRGLLSDLLGLFLGLLDDLLGLGSFNDLGLRSLHSLGLNSFWLASLYGLSRRGYRGGGSSNGCRSRCGGDGCCGSGGSLGCGLSLSGLSGLGLGGLLRLCY